MGAIAGTLATIAGAVYSDTLTGLPAGFVPLADSTLTGGTYAGANAFGAAVTGILAGQAVVVLAFRGSDDRQDWLDDLSDIDASYVQLAPLVAAVDGYAAAAHLPVIVTGHSLGGALAQQFMAEHPEAAFASYRAATFGSPGAAIEAAPDDRIVNYGIADDPVPYVGRYRAEIAQAAVLNPVYADRIAQDVAAVVGHGLTAQDISEAIAGATADDVNRGAIDTLPGRDGTGTGFTLDQILDLASFETIIRNDAIEHLPFFYALRSASAAIPDTDVPAIGNAVHFGATVHDAGSAGAEAYALYEGLLGRAPGLLDLERDAAALSAGASASGVADRLLSSEDGRAGEGASDHATFAMELYGVVLHRLPEPEGLAFWTGTLDAGASRADVGAGIALSAEHLAAVAPVLATGLFVPDAAAADVARLYHAVLDRAPDGPGLDVWTAAVKAGLPLATAAASFLASPEGATQPSLPAAADFVEALYENALGRHAEQAGLAGWVDAIDHGGASRGSVAAGIAESPEATANLAPLIETGWHLA